VTAAFVAASLLACRGSAQEARGETVMTQADDCTVTLEPGSALGAALEGAADLAVICLKPGTYTGSHLIARSVTLRALGEGVVLDAEQAGPVLAVHANGLTVRVEGVTLTGGRFETGGGFDLQGRSEVTLLKCLIKGNVAGDYGGGGVYANRGTLVVTDSVIEGNQSRWGGGVLADTVSWIVLEGTTIRGNSAARGGGLVVRDGAKVELKGGSIEGNTATDADGAPVYLAGTTTRGPELSIDGTTIDGEVHDAMGNATITRD
jgi:hypothetical protein